MTEGYKYYYPVRVRFHEVDMLGVCNNAVYINYFEESRLQYLKTLGLIPENGLFSDGSLFFMVRNEINYSGHAYYDDELRIYTRISYIKNSSYGFDHLVVRVSTGQIIADGKGVVARVDPETKRSITLSKEFTDTVKSFEPELKFI